MRAGAGARAAGAADHLAPRHVLAGPDSDRREVRVERREAGPVAEEDHVAVAAVALLVAGLHDYAVEGRVDAVCLQDGDVHAGVEPAPAVAERRLERALERDREADLGRWNLPVCAQTRAARV